MRTYLPILVIASSLCLQSCATGPPPYRKTADIPSSDALKQMVVFRHDPYENSYKIETPWLRDENYSRRGQLLLRTWTAGRELETGHELYRTKNMNVQIFLSFQFNDWQFLDRAYAWGGGKLKTSIISRDVIRCGEFGCLLSEDIAINLKLKEIETIVLVGRGFKFKVSGNSSDIPIFLEHKVLKGFLDALKENTKEV